MDRIGQAQEKVVASTRKLTDAAKGLAGQANILGKPGGIEAAKQQILDIQTSANMTDFAAAEAVAVATHSAYGTTGQLLTGEQLGIAKTVGGLQQRRGLSGGSVDNLIKLLAAKGVKNQEEAEKAIQQLLTVQQQSKIKDFETFLQGGTKSIIDAMTYGASWDMALGQFGSAMDVIMTGDEAATATKQMHELMQKGNVATEVGKMHGMSEEEFRNLSQDQKLIAFESWISKNATTGAGQKYLIEQGGLSATELGNAMKLYNQKQSQRIRFFKGLSEGATAEQFQAEAEGYAKTTAGKTEEAEAKKLRDEVSATDQEMLGMNLITEAEGRITTLTRQGKEPYPLAGEDRKRKTVARDILRERYEKLRSDVEAAGRLKEFEREFEAYEESLARLLPFLGG